VADLLVLCTGNICRSPMAEGFLRSALETRFGGNAPRVGSAGTQGWEGSGAQPESVQAAAERAVDISDHLARRLTRRQITGADLIVAMASEHRDAVLAADPSAAPRTFTLKELVRILEALPPAEPAGDPDALLARVDAAGALRRRGFTGNPRDEDVADPLGRPLDTYRAIAFELDGWIRRLVDGLYGRTAAPASIFGDEETA
jgi:low molecular weight protein-tyrosine phosphatase